MPAVNYDLMLQEFKRTGGKENQIVYWSRPLDGNRSNSRHLILNSIYFMAFYNTNHGPVVLQPRLQTKTDRSTPTLLTTWQMPLADGTLRHQQGTRRQVSAAAWGDQLVRFLKATSRYSRTL